MMPFMLGTGARENCCVTSLSHIGRAGAAASAMSEKVRTRLEELDDFEEVSSPLLGLSEQRVSPALLPRSAKLVGCSLHEASWEPDLVQGKLLGLTGQSQGNLK